MGVIITEGKDVFIKGKSKLIAFKKVKKEITDNKIHLNKLALNMNYNL